MLFVKQKCKFSWKQNGIKNGKFHTPFLRQELFASAQINLWWVGACGR